MMRTVFILELVIDGDPDDADVAVDGALDAGVLQDAIAESDHTLTVASLTLVRS